MVRVRRRKGEMFMFRARRKLIGASGGYREQQKNCLESRHSMGLVVKLPPVGRDLAWRRISVYVLPKHRETAGSAAR